MRNALKAAGAIVAVIALCAPLMFLPAEDTQPTTIGYATVTVTVPDTVVVATTIPGLETTTTTTEPPVTTPPVTTPPPSTTTTTSPVDITIAAVGGLYTTPEILSTVRDAETGSYDFGAVFAPVARYLSKPDYTVAALEPRLGGPVVGYDSETVPNAPRELAFAMKQVGIDMVGTANPHSLDLGWDGVVGTLDRLDAAGLAHVGTYRTSEERNTPTIVDVDGVKVAFLDYTAAVGASLPVSEQKPFAVNLLDLATVTQDANTARAWGADIVLALVDYGAEYQRRPTADQTGLANDILGHGVDVILGTRAGVVQTIGTYFPFSRTVNCYTAYSLGDFLAGPRAAASEDAAPQAGIAVYLRFQKRGLRTYLMGIDYLPLYVQVAYASGAEAAGKPVGFRVLPVLPGVEPDTDIPLTADDKARMSTIWNYVREQLYRPDEDITPLLLGQLGL